jgi:UDP-N-acetyl-D-mannosaminuronate dehydrogenase
MKRLKEVSRMIVTVKATYRNGQLIFHDSTQIPADGAEVIVNFENPEKTAAYSLRDSWAKYFPEDIDLNKELKEIRREWEPEMEGIHE